MTKVDFYPIDIDYIIAGNQRAVARIFGRTTSGERICVFDKAIEPYFWVIPKRGVEIDEFRKKIEEVRIKESDRVCFVVKTEITDKLYLNKEVKAIKVIVNHPKDIGIIKDRLKLMHETEAKKEVDIPYTRRYLIERGIIPLVLCSAEGEEIESSLEVDKVIEARELKQESGESFNKQRILAIDIEACYPANEETNPIIMVAFCGDDGFKKVVTYKKFETDNKNIKFVNDEAELIQEFKDTVREYKPDYLTGYFSDGFDFPYLRARADKYNMKLDLGLDRSSVKFSKRGQSSSCKIRGIVHIDIFKFIKNIMSGSLKGESYDLNSIASELLGEKKLDVDIYGLAKALEKNENLEKYCEYNLKDSELALNLLLKLIENINELVKLVGQPVFDVTRMSYGQLVEWHLIKRAKEFNEIVPNRPRRDVISKRRAKSYKGAFVFEPTAGLYERICVFDYRGLYPSVIVSKNIDPGMLSKYKYDSFETPEIETDGKKVRYLFSYKKEGFIPLVIKDLITRRIRIKEIIKNEKEKGEVDRALKARDYALKTLANAAYGYFAFFGARYYSLECAASITAFSREYIQKTIKAANDAGFKVVYSDTDSVAIILENKTENDALNFLEEVNRGLPSLMELELENFYERGIFVSKKSEEKGAKKKYAFVDKEGNMKVVGFETIRRNWSTIGREVQKKVLEIVLKENDKEKALKYAKEIIRDVREKKIEINKMVIKTQLRKEIEDYDAVGPHVGVAQRMRRQGIVINPGMMISFVVTEGKGRIRDRARLLEEVEGNEYDPDYYINNQIVPSIERIFEVLGYKKEDLLESHEQSKLGDFK